MNFIPVTEKSLGGGRDSSRDDREPQDAEQRTQEAGRKPLRNVPRELSEEELTAPGALRMLLGQVDRLEEENARLRGITERFHESDKAAAVLREQLKSQTHKIFSPARR